MIKTITGSVAFPRTGVRLAVNFQPKSGTTAVVGRNGSGKTFMAMEATRFLLYGKPALRGKAADYKSLSLTGSFTIKGHDFEIHRGKEEWIKDAAGEKIAVGAEKVTEKAVELMGYGLDVFDIVNAAVQGDIQSLGKLRPAQRKQLIDKIVGVTDISGVEKACRDEANGYKREAEALVQSVRPISEVPEPPIDYFPSVNLRVSLDRERETAQQAHHLRSQIRHVIEPVKPTTPWPVEDLAEHEERRRQVEYRRVELNKIVAAAHQTDYLNVYTEEQLQKAEARRLALDEIERRGPGPTMDIGEVLAMKDVWAEIAVLRRQEREDVECPECRHQFTTGRPVPVEPAVSLAELGRQEDAHYRWPDDGPEVPEGVDLNSQQIINAREANRLRVARVEAMAEIEKLPVLEDRSGEFQIQAEWQAWTIAVDAYEKQVEINQSLQEQIDELNPAKPEMIDRLVDQLARAVRYEDQLEAHTREAVAFLEIQRKIEEKKRLEKAFREGAEGLADARATLKALIAPRISRIASSLIADMTAGKINSVVLDDDMEIEVDGQRIETLSGAGVTVANIALRVAMGIALVGHTFPVFIGDEIDGDLDAERREATLQAMGGLTKRLKQIILITHRDVHVADHVFSAEEQRSFDAET